MLEITEIKEMRRPGQVRGKERDKNRERRRAVSCVLKSQC
jgi:hypothetical protein